MGTLWRDAHSGMLEIGDKGCVCLSGFLRLCALHCVKGYFHTAAEAQEKAELKPACVVCQEGDETTLPSAHVMFKETQGAVK